MKRVKTITYDGHTYKLKVTVEVQNHSDVIVGTGQIDGEIASTTDAVFRALEQRRSPSKIKVRNGRR